MDQCSAASKGISPSYNSSQHARQLTSIYRIPGIEPAYLQDKTECKQFLRMLSSFCENAECEDWIGGKIGPWSVQNIKQILSDCAAVLNDHERMVEWFPGYGCALLKYPSPNCLPQMVSLTVLGLDKHQFEISTGGNDYDYTGNAACFVSLHVGLVPKEMVPSISAKFQLFFDHGSRRIGDQRTAAGGKQGHQRTPAFIHALLVQAMNCQCDRCTCPQPTKDCKICEIKKCCCDPQQPKGGFTDVGLHTGGNPRDTSWPLARSVFEWTFLQLCAKDVACDMIVSSSSSSSDIEMVMLLFDVYILETYMRLENLDCPDRLRGKDDTSRATGRGSVLDTAAWILRAAVIKASALSDAGYDTAAMYGHLVALKQTLCSTSASLEERLTRSYSLKHEEITSLKESEFRDPVISLPPPVTPSSLVLSSDACRMLSAKNLEFFPVVSQQATLSQLEQWLAKLKVDVGPVMSSDKVVFTMRIVEQVLWNGASSRLDAPLQESEIKSLENVIDCYRKCHQVFQSQPEHEYLMAVELQSRELLVTWYAYCLADSAVRHEGSTSSLMKPYGVALRYADLKHLVLSDRRALRALERVALYLARYENGAPLFSLADERPTFELAVSYGEDHLQSIWRKEQADAMTRVKKHWAEVKRKQALAATLREEVSTIEDELAAAGSELREAEGVCSETFGKSKNRRRRDRIHRDACSRQVDSIRRNLNSKTESLKSAEAPPPPVLQPLPSDETKAMRVLFFMYMPMPFRVLSRLSFTSQQLLIPRPWTGPYGGVDGCESISVFPLVQTPDTESWTEYYNAKKSGCDVTEGWVRLRYKGEIDPPKWKHVDDITSESHGVWYPNNLVPSMAWTGGPHVFDQRDEASSFDPFGFQKHSTSFEPFGFQRHSTLTAAYFTAQLSGGLADMQWSMFQPGFESVQMNRGNRPFAAQDAKPKGLSRNEYFRLASIRSFPLRQLRGLMAALESRPMPFRMHDIPSLRTVIQQVIFHVGNLTVDKTAETVQMVWKTDLESEQFLANMYSVFQDCAEELQDCPIKALSAGMVGELSGFFSDWNERLKDIARAMATAAKGWAESLDLDINEIDPSRRKKVRLKQAKYYNIAIACLATGQLSNQDVAELLQLQLLCRNLFLEDGGAEIKELEFRSENAICHRLFEISRIINSHGEILTIAVRSVIASCPDLDWAPWLSPEGAPTACWEALSAGDATTWYHVNIVKGIVLVNGMPPSRLPATIRKHKLYARVFGCTDFEVFERDGLFQTLRPSLGRLYRFFEADGRLIIRESAVSGLGGYDEGMELELLDVNYIDKWGANLPLILKANYSHWAFRKFGVVCFRDIGFRSRRLRYIYDPTSGCRPIPDHIETDHWLNASVCAEFRSRLVIHNCSFMGILNKFECRTMIHTFLNKSGNGCDGELQVHLPRFDLSFTLTAGYFVCNEIEGFGLSEEQQLVGTWRGFSEYLILSDRGKRIKIVVPSEAVVVSPNAASVARPSDWEQGRRFYIYDVHPRFRYIVARCVESRLHLAAIHLATTSVLPDPLLGMTGAERCSELLRQCWVNRPLSPDEQTRLNNIISLCSCFAPEVYLGCFYLQQSSEQLSFLHRAAGRIGRKRPSCDEVTAYQLQVESSPSSSRFRLSPVEERAVIGHLCRAWSSRRLLQRTVNVEQCPVSRSDIELIVNSLKRHVGQYMRPGVGTFPFHDASIGSKLEAAMYQELEDSWECFSKSPSWDITGDGKSLQLIRAEFASHLLQASKLRAVAETYLRNSIGEINDKTTSCLGFLQIANIIPSVSLSDLAMLACSPSRILHFNPLLSQPSIEQLAGALVLWLELCVLEDKLNRLQPILSASGASQELTRELRVEQIWNGNDHPYWLVLEVEGGLQIRPEQFMVAQHLLEHPGNVVQLNMGAGKTRVILPMMLLYWSFKSSSSKTKHKTLPRVHILSPLFREAEEFFHRTLTASVLGIKMFTLPFSRSVQLDQDDNRIASMLGMLNHAKDVGGFFLVKPEHRLSLELKEQELRYGQRDLKLCQAIRELVEDVTWHDVMDEVDEILNPRFQLIYAMGKPTPLESGPHRWRAGQAILETLKEMDHAMLQRVPGILFAAEEFPAMKISHDILLERHKSGFREAVAESLVSNPPRSLWWLTGHKRSSDIVACMANPQADPSILKLPQEQMDDVLAVRGLLAGDLLIHCLQKRHRVHFGVAGPGRKLMAVPFRGADTPSDRAEYAHPDVAIVLTILAYYSDGLSPEEVRAAFECLLIEGARSKIYHSWFSLSAKRMTVEGSACLKALDKVEKIDLSNENQFRCLCQYYAKNMKVINFWLNSCVFPIETQQFPKRLVGNSWHLARLGHRSNGRLVGFSGTNDIHRLLPLQVKQFAPSEGALSDVNGRLADEWKDVIGTNGAMLNVLIRRTIGCVELEEGRPRDSLLKLVKSRVAADPRFGAIIDSGALLAGIENSALATRDLNCITSGTRYRGTVFFDEKQGRWMIAAHKGIPIPTNVSPVHEKDAFALFDEPRCRGTDLKLNSDVIAVLTLGPDACKDKVMQSAGRLRKLVQSAGALQESVNGQGLIITADRNTFDRIRACAGLRNSAIEETSKSGVLNVLHVLKWVMENTVNSTISGLPAWVEQGCYFATTHDEPELAVRDDDMSLVTLYGRPFVESSIAESAKLTIDSYRRCRENHSEPGKRKRTDVSTLGGEILDGIESRSRLWGQEFFVCAQKLDEECERELELQLHRENQEAVEVPAQDAAREVDWDLRAVFQCTPSGSFPAATMPLSRFVSQLLSPTSLRGIGWRDNIFCTANFANTVRRASRAEGKLDLYLRPVDTAVVFENGEVLLLSERETDLALKEFWNRRPKPNSYPILIQLCFARASADADKPPYFTIPRWDTSFSSSSILTDHTLACLQLFAGETSYATPARKAALKDILDVKSTLKGGSRLTSASGEPERLVQMRGFDHLFSYSDLEDICTDLARDAQYH